MIRLAIVVLLVATACSAADEGGERHTVFTHCGFYETEFDGVLWTPASIERGASPDGTGFNATEGVMTRMGDRARFVADSGLEIWFEAAPPGLPPPPPCD